MNMQEQMGPILKAVDVLLFTEPKHPGDPRDTWKAELYPLMEEIGRDVGTDNVYFVYQIAVNQMLRTALDERFYKVAMAIQKKKEEREG